MPEPDNPERLFSALTDRLASHTAVALILPSILASNRDIINSGTLTLVETPIRQVFITAHHVWDEFVTRRDSAPEVVLAAYLGHGRSCIALEEIEYLDGDRSSLDVAILHAPNVRQIFLPTKRFFRVPAWPIPVPRVGECVDIIGYASIDRDEIAAGLVLGSSYFGLGVSSISDRQFVLAPTYGARLLLRRNPNHDENFSIGGMSGGPAFLVREGSTHLVGIIRAGLTAQNSIFVSQLRFLRADGTLDQHLIPP